MTARDGERREPRFDPGEAGKVAATGAVAGALALVLLYAAGSIVHVLVGVPLW